MELKLKDDVQEKKTERKEDFLSDEELLGAYTNNPVRITSTATVPDTVRTKSSFDLMGIIKWVIIIAVVVVAGKFIMGLINPKVTDVTDYVGMDTAQLEGALDITLEEGSEMKKQISHYSNGQVTVDGNGEIGVVYIDGKHKGLHINNKKYNMFGVTIGDGEFTLDDNMTYQYDDSFNVLNDMIGGKSTATFYFNRAKNDCLVIIINDKSARVVAMTYFNDYKLISENLSGIDE